MYVTSAARDPTPRWQAGESPHAHLLSGRAADTDVGPETCAGYEGSYNHEVVDAQTYASWGVDFVEEDSCHHGDIKPYIPYQVLYGRMRDALNATGRPVTFYMCVQGQEEVHRWGAATGNLWRTTGDICGPGHATWRGVMNNFYGNARWPNASSPGAWQDPDMLVVGMPIDGKMDNHTLVQWRTHFSLWAMAAAPLWIGIDMTKMPESALAVFSNAAVIAVDQDPLGRMATCRSPGGCPPPGSPARQRLGYHRCDAVMRWSYTQDTGVFTVLDGAALTAKSCAPEPAGDPMIVWPEVVPETCGGQKPGNQAFVVNASGLVILQSGLCVAPDASNAPVSGPCSSPAARVVWDASLGQLRTQDGDQPVCLGVPAAPPGEVQVWARPLAPSERSRHRAAVALFNPSESGHGNVTVTWSQVGLVDGTAARATDLWTGTVTTSSEGYAASDVGPQAVVMLLVEQ